MNIIAGKACISVVCQSRGPFFTWCYGLGWNAGDDLPAAVVLTLPECERERCERHRVRRLGMRRAA